MEDTGKFGCIGGRAGDIADGRGVRDGAEEMLDAEGERRGLVDLAVVTPGLAQLREGAGPVEGTQARGGMQEPVQACDVGEAHYDLGVGADGCLKFCVGEQGGEELVEGGPADGADYC